MEIAEPEGATITAITYQESGFTSPISLHFNGSSHKDSAYPHFTDMEDPHAWRDNLVSWGLRLEWEEPMDDLGRGQRGSKGALRDRSEGIPGEAPSPDKCRAGAAE